MLTSLGNITEPIPIVTAMEKMLLLRSICRSARVPLHRSGAAAAVNRPLYGARSLFNLSSASVFPVPSKRLFFGKYMASLATTDVCDSHPTLLPSGDLRVLQPIFQIYGQRRAFSGPIVTVKVFEDNVLVRELLQTKGEGRILVIDGGGSTRCALLGGNMAQLAHSSGWAGVVVNGCVRDVDEINDCDIGVRALTSHPLKSNKKGTGEKHVPIYVAGALIRDGEWLYADSDGILVSKSELSL